jgi:uncharacterized protein (TIGR02147 family)
MGKKPEKSINVYDYTDYRKFLFDYYEGQKALHAYFTVRYIAEKVGFRSASFFSQVTRGRSNLSNKLVQKFARFLKLNKKQAEYFEILVLYNQAKTQESRRKYFEKLNTFKEASSRVLRPNEYEFYRHWYYAAVRDILSFYRFKGDYQELARLVESSITPEKARKAISLLRDLGMIKVKKDGAHVLTNHLLSTQSEERSVGLNTYAMQMMDQAKDSLNRLPKEERSISWVGFSASAETFKKIQQEARDFRKRVLKLAEDDADPNRAWHFNIQVFPVSKEHNKSREGNK